MRGSRDTAALPLRQWLDRCGPHERATLARLWSLDPELAPDDLAAALLEGPALDALLARLAAAERSLLARVQERGGEIPAAVLEREGGLVRSHDAYANPREFLLALRAPPSATERLYLLGLIQLVGHGSERRYAIPPDLLPLLPEVPPRDGRIAPARADAPADILPGDAALLERRLLALLSLARDGQLELVPAGGLNKASLVRLARQWGVPDDLAGVTREDQWPYAGFVRRSAEAAGLLTAGTGSLLRVAPAALEWLRLTRAERLQSFTEGWVEADWDELAALEGIRAQRPYSRDVPAARRALLGLVAQAPAGEWVDLDSLMAEVRRVEPDFARPDGDYFRSGLQGPDRQPLGGFVHWERVEGAQIRAVVGSSMRWAGLVDVGLRDGRPASFRLNAYGAALLHGAPAPDEPPNEPLVVQPNFDVLAPAHASLYARFQLGRFAEQRGGDGAAVFRMTRRSILAAAERGVSVDDVVRFLEQQSGRAAPQNVTATLGEWAGRFGQVSLRRGYVLQASDAAMLEQAARDPRVRLPAVERLGEAAWLVREGDARELSERLRKAGYGLAADDAPAVGLSERDLEVAAAALEFYAGACALLGVPCEASPAVRRRVARVVRGQALNRAYQASGAALNVLRERVASEEGGESGRAGERESG